MSVTIWHVGSAAPVKLVDADEFSTDDSGVLRVARGSEVVAVFAATKWSAAIRAE